MLHSPTPNPRPIPTAHTTLGSSAYHSGGVMAAEIGAGCPFQPLVWSCLTVIPRMPSRGPVTADWQLDSLARSLE